MAAACSPTACTSPDCATNGCAKSSPNGEPSCNGAGPESASTTTCEPLALTLFESTSSPAASRARAQARPGSATGSSTPKPFCGERWPEPSASFDPDTCSWRTWRTSLQSETEPSGEKFSGTWPRSGSMSRGIAYPLPPSAPRTSVTGSSPLLPTPRAKMSGPSSRRGSGATGGPELGEAINLLPTPSATPYGNNQSPPPGAAVRPSLDGLVKLLPTPTEVLGGTSSSAERTGFRGEPTLSGLVKLLPTPRANDGLRPRLSTASEGFGKPLEQMVVECKLTGSTSSRRSADGKPSTGLRLNPCFVEWMMGAPSGWSDPDCPLSATEFKSSSGYSSESAS